MNYYIIKTVALNLFLLQFAYSSLVTNGLHKCTDEQKKFQYDNIDFVKPDICDNNT